MVNALGALALLASAVACTSTTTSTPNTGASSGAPAGEDAGGGDAGAPGSSACTSARDQLLVPVDKVSTGQVTVVSTSGATRKIYVEAAAGGPQGAAKNPRVYVDLAAGARVDVTDKTALGSKAWDLALKRTVIFTNGGDGGPGQGAAAELTKSFESITSADAAAASAEVFFDADCNPQLDPINNPNSTFASWYDYDTATNGVTPKNVTYVVRGGTGKLYKVKILSFTANPDGTTTRASTGYFLLDVAEL
jgi:hypothetical protein